MATALRTSVNLVSVHRNNTLGVGIIKSFYFGLATKDVPRRKTNGRLILGRLFGRG